MKTLTVRQPWAWAIARGHKNIENRRWATSYRGPLAIHSGLRFDDAGTAALQAMVATIRATGGQHPAKLTDDEPYCNGGIVLAVVDLTGICTASLHHPGKVVCDCGPWAQPEQAHWKVANARVLAAPFPARGRLILWDCEVPT